MANKSQTEKQIQIPLRLLKDIDGVIKALYARSRDKLRDEDIIYIKSIQSEINNKFERMERHETFTKYKTSESGTPEREAYRNEYLEQTGVHKDFRTSKEIHLNGESAK